MGHVRNTIPNPEYYLRLSKIIPIFEVRTDTKEDLKELYFLYNDRLTPRKTDLHCGKCVRYVINRMFIYYKELNAPN